MQRSASFDTDVIHLKVQGTYYRVFDEGVTNCLCTHITDGINRQVQTLDRAIGPKHLCYSLCTNDANMVVLHVHMFKTWMVPQSGT